MITVFLRVLSIFCLVGIGFILNKRGILPKESIGYLTGVLLTVATPCLNYVSLASMPFDPEKIRPIWEVSLGSLIYYVYAMVITFIVVRTIIRKKQDAGVLMAIMTSVNCGFMGFPVTKAIFGEEFLFFVVIINAVSQIYVFFFMILQMQYGSEVKSNISPTDTLKGMINMPFVFTIIGFAVFLLNIKTPVVLLDLMEMLGDITIPLSMIVIGVQLGSVSVKHILLDRTLLTSAFVKLILLPAGVFIITYMLPVSVFSKVTLPLAFCFPTAAITTSLAHKYNKNETLMAEGVAITTLFSMLTVSGWCILLTYIYL